jgi:hypothetical protein
VQMREVAPGDVPRFDLEREKVAQAETPALVHSLSSLEKAHDRWDTAKRKVEANPAQ